MSGEGGFYKAPIENIKAMIAQATVKYNKSLKQGNQEYLRQPESPHGFDRLIKIAQRERTPSPQLFEVIRTPRKNFNRTLPVKEKHTFTPTLSQTTKSIAVKLGRSSKRLLTPSKSPQAQTTFSHRPQLNANSLRLLKNRYSQKEKRWEKLYSLHKYLQDKRVNNLDQNQNQDTECTFSPKIQKRKSNKNQQDMVNRFYEWAKEKESRIKTTRQGYTQMEIDNCTFSPKINKSVLVSSKSVVNCKGVVKFLRSKKQMNSSVQTLTPKASRPRLSPSPSKPLTIGAYKSAMSYLHIKLRDFK